MGTPHKTGGGGKGRSGGDSLKAAGRNTPERASKAFQVKKGRALERELGMTRESNTAHINAEGARIRSLKPAAKAREVDFYRKVATTGHYGKKAIGRRVLAAAGV